MAVRQRKAKEPKGGKTARKGQHEKSAAAIKDVREFMTLGKPKSVQTS